jgi:hypothetical protein
MYLGRNIQTVRAVDSRQVYAQAAAVKAPKAKRAAKPLEVQNIPEPVAVIDNTAIVEAQEKEIAQLREQNAIYRGRIHKLLDVLRGKNRTIARQEREIQALGQSDPLTVDQILAGEKVNA